MSLVAPLFTAETALERVKFAQDAWNSKDPERIVKGLSAISFPLFVLLRAFRVYQGLYMAESKHIYSRSR